MWVQSASESLIASGNRLLSQLQHRFGHRSISLFSPLELCIFLEHCLYIVAISGSSDEERDEEGAPTLELLWAHPEPDQNLVTIYSNKALGGP